MGRRERSFVVECRSVLDRMKRCVLTLPLLFSMACASVTEAPDSASPGNSEAGAAVAPGAAPRIERTTLRGSFVEVEVRIPALPRGPKATILTPFGQGSQWLERGFVIVRYRPLWNQLAGLREKAALAAPARDPEPAAAEAVGVWLLRSPRPGIIGRGYFGFIHFASGLASEVVDYLETLPDVDSERIGIAGSSTTGFTALESLALEPRLAAAVVRVSCGDYHSFLRESSLALAGDPKWLPDGEMLLDDDYEAELLEHEPIQHAELFPPRPILMQNGADDAAIPFACAERTAEEFERAYEAAGVAERFRFRVYPGAGHNLPKETAEEAMAFFEEWLGPADMEGPAPERGDTEGLR